MCQGSIAPQPHRQLSLLHGTGACNPTWSVLWRGRRCKDIEPWGSEGWVGVGGDVRRRSIVIVSQRTRDQSIMSQTDISKGHLVRGVFTQLPGGPMEH